MSSAYPQLARLLEIVMTLRSPAGCPWDREQTLKSMRSYLLEETYEVLEAIAEGSEARVREELGDLLFNVLLMAQIGADAEAFDIEQIACGIAEKLERRHPHVFGESAEATPQPSSTEATPQPSSTEATPQPTSTEATPQPTSTEVGVQWNRLKRAERPRETLFGSLPASLPALLRARRITDRAADVGFEWPSIAGVWSKIEEEQGELHAALAEGCPNEIAHEFGDVLFAWVNLGRFIGIEPEQALQATNRRFMSRFSYVEAELHRKGRSLEAASLEEMDALWNEAKALE